MNRKWTVYFLILIAFAFCLQLVVSFALRDDKRIIEAFETGNNVPMEGTLVVRANTTQYLVSSKDREQMLTFIANGLKIHEYELNSEHTMLSCSNDRSNVAITIKKAQQSMQLETIITCKQINALVSLKELVSALYQQLGFESQCNMKIEGYSKGLCSKVQIEQLKNDMFQVLECRTIKQQNIDDCVYYYGYTDLIGQQYQLHGKRMNVQLKIYYDEITDQTKVELAVPFLQET